eukprot:10643-Heterococcus_DN1.PRE.1
MGPMMKGRDSIKVIANMVEQVRPTSAPRQRHISAMSALTLQMHGMCRNGSLVVDYYSDVISAAKPSLLLRGYKHNTMLPAARTILSTAQNIYSGAVLALRTEVVELVARLRPADAAAMLKWCTLLRLADDTGELTQPDASNSTYKQCVFSTTAHCICESAQLLDTIVTHCAAATVLLTPNTAHHYAITAATTGSRRQSMLTAYCQASPVSSPSGSSRRSSSRAPSFNGSASPSSSVGSTGSSSRRSASV